MRKVIIIGRATLDIAFSDAKPSTAVAGGRLLQLAATLGAQSEGRFGVSLISELSMDAVGDMIIDHLTANGVDTTSVDRYADGVTPVNLLFDSGQKVSYRNNDAEGFDVVWPRIDRDDVVVFGGMMAIDARTRKQIVDIIDFARTRKATIIYVTSLTVGEVTRVTRIMPALLDNFELADRIVITADEMKMLFGADDIYKCFRDNIAFYCRDVNVITPESVINFEDAVPVSDSDLSTPAFLPDLVERILLQK